MNEEPANSAGREPHTADFMSLFNDLIPNFAPHDRDAHDAAVWLNLAHRANQWAQALSTGNVYSMTDLGLGLVRSLLDIEQAQMRALRSVERNTRMLLEGPAKTGRILLEQAQLAERPERARDLINEANKRFYDALPLASEPRDAVVVKMHLGVTALLLDHRDEARRWIGETYRDVGQEVVSLAHQSGNVSVKVFENKKDVAWFLAFGAGFVIHKKRKNRRRRNQASPTELSVSKKSEDALRELLPVLHCLAIIHNAALVDQGTARLPALRLEPAGKAFRLVEVEAIIQV